MAVVNTKSSIVTQADAGVFGNFRGKPLLCQVATVEVAAADDDTSVYRLFRVQSSIIIVDIKLACDALTSGTAYELGLHKIAKNGGTVIDADLFGSAIDLSSAIDFTSKLYEATATNKDKVASRLWEYVPGSLTEDPQLEYDITLTATTVGSAAGTISAQLFYFQ